MTVDVEACTHVDGHGAALNVGRLDRTARANSSRPERVSPSNLAAACTCANQDDLRGQPATGGTSPVGALWGLGIRLSDLRVDRSGVKPLSELDPATTPS
jgi:hypothetical protein